MTANQLSQATVRLHSLTPDLLFSALLQGSSSAVSALLTMSDDSQIYLRGMVLSHPAANNDLPINLAR